MNRPALAPHLRERAMVVPPAPSFDAVLVFERGDVRHHVKGMPRRIWALVGPQRNADADPKLFESIGHQRREQGRPRGKIRRVRGPRQLALSDVRAAMGRPGGSRTRTYDGRDHRCWTWGAGRLPSPLP